MTNILIVDDEPLARRRLQILLDQLGVAATEIAEATGVESALGRLESGTFQIVLLDISMRDGSGFDVIRRLPEGIAPAIIFITAFDDYAVHAFEIAAADYLVKPVAGERLERALARAAHVLDTVPLDKRRLSLNHLAELEQHDAAPDSWETEFWIRRGNGDFVRLEAASIDYAVVEDDYVRIFSSGRSYLLRASIRGFLKRLDPEEFVQVHRKALVRRDALMAITRSRLGHAEVQLRSGERLPLGRVYGKTVEKMLRGKPNARGPHVP